MNTTVNGGAAALLVASSASTSNGATAEGFGKAMRAAEILQGVHLKGGRPSSATPAPTPTPTLTSSPNGTSLPLWDTPAPLGQASLDGTAPAEGPGPTEDAQATGETSAGSRSIPVAENLLLIQQLTASATPVPALAAVDGAVPGAAVAPEVTSAADASVTGGSTAAGTIAGASAVVTTQALVTGTTTTVSAGNASAAIGATVTSAGGAAATNLAALAGAPQAANNPAINNADVVHPRGDSAVQTVTAQPVTAQSAAAQTTTPVQPVTAQPAAIVNAPTTATAQPAAAPAAPAAPSVALLPGVQVAVAANASAVQTAAVNAVNAAKTANASTTQEQTVAPLSGPQAAGAAPSSSVSAPAAPAPAAPAAPTPQPLVTQVGKPMLQLAALANGEHTVTLNVSPDNLGQVTVRAHVGSDGIRVDLFAATDSGREALKSILGDLRRDLAATGGNSSLNLSGDGQPGASGGRGFADRTQQNTPDQHIATTETEMEPETEPDAPRLTNSTSTLDLMA